MPSTSAAVNGMAAATPRRPPARESTTDSDRTSQRTSRGRNPSARITATSETLSRALIAIVLATMRTIVKRTVSMIERMSSLTLPSISTNCSRNCFSGIALTGEPLFSKKPSIASAMRGTSSGLAARRT